MAGHFSYFMRSCIHTNTVTVYTDTNQMCQMSSYTEPSRISYLETVWKGAGTVKKNSLQVIGRTVYYHPSQDSFNQSVQ